MPIKTTQVLSVSPEEVQRVDRSESEMLALVDTLGARVRALEAELATRPPVVVPPPVIPPPSNDVSLRVQGYKLLTAKGTEVRYRGIECLWGSNSAGSVERAIDAMKALGANFVAPLFQKDQSSAANVRSCIAAAERKAMGCAVNADAAGVDRAWLKRSDIVAECNAGKGVILECEVELGSTASMTASQWKDYAIDFVMDLRRAGHKSPIRVGSPNGGRSPRYALQTGKDIVEADPLHSLMFTWQAYWEADTSGWQYAWDEGFSSGTAGALECADALKDSGLCWLVGLDGRDDVGLTPFRELAARLHQHGIAWQWWAMMVGDAYGNGLVSDPLSATSIKMPFGPDVRALLTAQSNSVVF